MAPEIGSPDSLTIVDAQRVLSALMADSYRSSLWAAAYVINGGCSDDGFDYFRGWLILQGRETFGQAVADPDSLDDLAAVRLAIANQAIVECESALYIPARAHRAATGDEIPDDAYRMEPLELLGGWDFNFDDQREIKQRLPQLTALCWCGPHGS